MLQRLTKRDRRCKAFLGLALLALGSTAGHARTHDHEKLRLCVSKAGSLAAMAACERQYTKGLLAHIATLDATIRQRVKGPRKRAFEKSAKSWQNYLSHEQALLRETLGKRHDGLGPGLLPGAVNLLYENRIKQLKVHLRSLPPR